MSHRLRLTICSCLVLIHGILCRHLAFPSFCYLNSLSRCVVRCVVGFLLTLTATLTVVPTVSPAPSEYSYNFNVLHRYFCYYLSLTTTLLLTLLI